MTREQMQARVDELEDRSELEPQEQAELSRLKAKLQEPEGDEEDSEEVRASVTLPASTWDAVGESARAAGRTRSKQIDALVKAALASGQGAKEKREELRDLADLVANMDEDDPLREKLSAKMRELASACYGVSAEDGGGEDEDEDSEEEADDPTKYTAAQWVKQAKAAIEQGQSETDFVASAHKDNRAKARAAYQKAKKAVKPYNVEEQGERRKPVNPWDSMFMGVKKYKGVERRKAAKQPKNGGEK